MNESQAPVDSLYVRLTSFGQEHYPATEYIALLIRSLAQDACRSRRFTHYFCQIIERSRDIYNDINNLIQEYEENSDLNLTEKMNLFKKFTKMIMDLEEYLNRSFGIMGAETRLLETDNDSSELEEDAELDARIVNPRSIERWNDHKAELTNIMTQLHTKDSFEPPSEDWETRAEIKLCHDTLVWCTAVFNTIERVTELQNSVAMRCRISLNMACSQLLQQPLSAFSDNHANLVLHCAMKVCLLQHLQINAISSDNTDEWAKMA
ncbi:hypothetical protein FRC02_004676, partial [Tulasnella sp. 418]